MLAKGTVGEVYNIGGLNEKTNIEIVQTLCNILDTVKPASETSGSILSYSELMTFIKDRPGHDRRYAINAAKIQTELDWQPSESFETGIQKTVQWYLRNLDWVEQVISGDYRNWVAKQYT